MISQNHKIKMQQKLHEKRAADERKKNEGQDEARHENKMKHAC